jgi:hypothetical protein
MSSPIAILAQELNEARAELARHHRDFGRISLACELFFEAYGDGELDLAPAAPYMRDIRKIVG